MYIDTEGAFSAERLVEMARALAPADRLDDLLQRVTVVPERTCAGLLQRLQVGRVRRGARGALLTPGRPQSIDEMLLARRAKLLVVDSVASPVRREFDTGNGKAMIERSGLLVQIASILKCIADTLEIVVRLRAAALLLCTAAERTA